MVLCFFHVFFGHRREGDLEDWPTKPGAQAGVLALCTLVDRGYGDKFDLRNAKAVER